MNELASKYDILKVIGHGGFSAVFKARSKADPEKIVALKQLDYSIANEEAKEYQYFKEEVATLKKLDHRNIVQIFSAQILDNKPSLEMEFVDGETLETVLRHQKYLPVPEVLDMIEQIAMALSYCHHYHNPDAPSVSQNAVIHNDINPKNIIRTTNHDGSYRYVLVDFGLSFTDPDTVRHSKKEDGMAEYKSPEKWKASDVDTPSDIYGFGVVIYELLAGEVPFAIKDYNNAADMMALEQKHRVALVPDVCKKRMAAIQAKEYIMPETCDIPRWLQLLIKKCLKKEPSQRFKTGRELLEFYYKGMNGSISEENESVENPVVSIDPNNKNNFIRGAYLEVVPNILTEAQHFFLQKDYTSVGRSAGLPGIFSADFSLRTADKFISKNHCQIVKKISNDGELFYYLSDVVPSKNGTFFNTEKNSTRLQPHVRIRLKDGDYFWVGNTRIIFHQ